MKLDLFFKGMQNKETTASAWLATLLRDEPGFRHAFFEHLPIAPALDVDAGWTVEIEMPLGGGFCDITLESEAAFVLIENNVSASAVTERQVLGYYLGALSDPGRAEKRLVVAYLGPTATTGIAELGRLEADPAFQARTAVNGDATALLGWQTDIPAIVEAADLAEPWFARAGRVAILDHVAALQRGRPFEQQREDLRQLMTRVASRVDAAGAAIGGWGPDVRLDRWASRGQEVLYTPGQSITTWLTLSYPESRDGAFEVGEVFVGNEVHVRAAVSFNPSTKIGLRDRTLMGRWEALIGLKAVWVPDLGEMGARGEIAFERALDFDGAAADLEDLLVAWATAVLAFLKQERLTG